MTTRAPPTITIVKTAEAAAEMTAMESMTSAPLAATKAVTTTAHPAAVAATAHSATAHATAAVTTTTTTTTTTAAPTHQDQRTARCTQLLGVAGIARQRGQRSGGGKSQRNGADETRLDNAVFDDGFHDGFHSLDVSPTRRAHTRELVLPARRDKTKPCGIIYQRVSTSLERDRRFIPYHSFHSAALIDSTTADRYSDSTTADRYSDSTTADRYSALWWP